MRAFITVLCSISLFWSYQMASAGAPSQNSSDLNLALILHNCRNASTPFLIQTLTNTALWTTRRLNSIYGLDLTVGLSVHQVCTETDYLQTIFKLYLQNTHEKYLIGIVSNRVLSKRVQQFTKLLKLTWFVFTMDLYTNLTVRAAVKAIAEGLFLSDSANYGINILTPNERSLLLFAQEAENNNICIKDYYIYRSTPIKWWSHQKMDAAYVIVFGDKAQIEAILKCQFTDSATLILAPLDGSILTRVPPNSYILHPPHSASAPSYTHLLPTPILFQIANPIINYVQCTSNFIRSSCNQTTYKINCLRSKFNSTQHCSHYRNQMNPDEILEKLNITVLQDKFHYNLFKVYNNSNYEKVLSYNLFYDNVTMHLDENSSSLPNPIVKVDENYTVQELVRDCMTIKGDTQIVIWDSQHISRSKIRIRPEPWIFGFLALSLLGVIICLAVFVFLLSSIYQKDSLEGNPVLTLLLLISIIWIFCSIIPQCIEESSEDDSGIITEYICLGRTLTLTLSLASAFSLILSRCILLATASKQLGFMSHIAGPIQAFLCLFIFGVQAALSVHLIGQCNQILHSSLFFVCCLSYNCILLILLLCFVPITCKNRRNYNEGKYFAIATIGVSALWCVWIPILYCLDDENWRDPLLCFGLDGTGGILLGTIFVPRTYLMTIASTRDRLTGTMPSISTGDVFSIHNSHQPIYDCINVATINTAGHSSGNDNAGFQQQEHDIYTCPTLPASPTAGELLTIQSRHDKTTRF